MTRVNENKIWRVVARIDDEIIVKQAASVEKATRSARNAVCLRLCSSAEIEYEIGWWKGSRHKSRRDFVDNFIGIPLYVQTDDPLEIEIHEVPYEVYTVEQVRMTFRRMTLMSPENIDSWGYLHWGQGDDEKLHLLGESLPIPQHLSKSKGFEEEVIIALSDAQECLKNCPQCGSQIPFGTIILLTENFRLIPANCCDKMVWLRESDSVNNQDWT